MLTFYSITVRWDELSCVDHNGELTEYRIEYGITPSDNMETVTGTSFTATGLLPLTTYMFRVAAMNGNGTGPYITVTGRTLANNVAVTVHGGGTPTEDSSYTLICTVSGHQSLMNRTIMYQWSSDSNNLQGPTDQMTYTFNPVDRYDNGTYTCRVTISSPLLNSNIVEEDSTPFQVTGCLFYLDFFMFVLTTISKYSPTTSTTSCEHLPRTYIRQPHLDSAIIWRHCGQLHCTVQC